MSRYVIPRAQNFGKFDLDVLYVKYVISSSDIKSALHLFEFFFHNMLVKIMVTLNFLNEFCLTYVLATVTDLSKLSYKIIKKGQKEIKFSMKIFPLILNLF